MPESKSWNSPHRARSPFSHQLALRAATTEVPVPVPAHTLTLLEQQQHLSQLWHPQWSPTSSLTPTRSIPCCQAQSPTLLTDKQTKEYCESHAMNFSPSPKEFSSLSISSSQLTYQPIVPLLNARKFPSLLYYGLQATLWALLAWLKGCWTHSESTRLWILEDVGKCWKMLEVGGCCVTLPYIIIVLDHFTSLWMICNNTYIFMFCCPWGAAHKQKSNCV